VACLVGTTDHLPAAFRQTKANDIGVAMQSLISSSDLINDRFGQSRVFAPVIQKRSRRVLAAHHVDPVAKHHRDLVESTAAKCASFSESVIVTCFAGCTLPISINLLIRRRSNSKFSLKAKF
jgi:hypothetical protein